MTKLDKLVRAEGLRKAQIFRVAIAWRGKQSVDSIIGVYEDIGAAMNVSNASQVHLTDIMLATPGIVAADGRVFVALDDAGAFSAFADEESARRHVAVRGGRMKGFVLNAAPAAVTAGAIQGAERAAIAAFAGTGTEMSKAALAAIKSALARPLSAAKSLWR